MREILFRAKEYFSGRWKAGLVTAINEDSGWCLIRPMNDNMAYECDLRTLCQYTGLTDKDSRKIFEGDILAARLDDDYPGNVTYVRVVWNGFSWCIREKMGEDVIDAMDCNSFEVCGNIFDNPELTKLV